MNENSTALAPVNALAAIPEASLSDFQEQVFNLTPNRLTQASLRAGTTDTLMHVGMQLTTEQVVNHILTIVRVAFAAIPKTVDGVPVTNDAGEVIIETYPVCHFAEAPGYWYNGGSMLKKNIEAWAREVGDSMEDPNLPLVNQTLSEIGGVRAFFGWKNKRDSSGQKYVNIILA